MNRMFGLIRDYFGFSRTESRGLFVLLIFTSLAIMSSVVYQKHNIHSYHILEEDKLVLKALISDLETNTKKVEPKVSKQKSAPVENKKFLFDPNTAEVKQLTALGIPDFLARRIEKYRTKGGRFYQAEDLLKIYGFDQDLYHRLEDYIRIKKKKKIRKAVNQEKTAPTYPESHPTELFEKAAAISRIDINKVDSLSLQRLSGIGQVTSSRIVRFRDKLGGIHQMEQLSDVYHISDEALSSLKKYAFVEDSFEPNKVNVNQADFKTLLSHPYIDYELAKAIVNHRRIYGNFSTPEQLKEVYQMNQELLVKLLPYLVI